MNRKMLVRWFWMVLVVGALAACSGGNDAQDAGPVGADGGGSDAAACACGPACEGAGNCCTHIDDCAPTAIEAVPGVRCRLTERIGLMEIVGREGTPYVFGMLYDGPSPFFTEPSQSTDVCDFHELPPAFCNPACTGEQVCGPDGTCLVPPARLTGERLVVSSGDDRQVLTDLDQGVSVDLPAGDFDLELQVAKLTITVSATSMPALLDNLAVRIQGSYDAPGDADITWTPSTSGAEVFTSVPMNHHVGGTTFTECAVDASAGALHIEASMLTPLAVSTGLEFQGVSHVRFAAAETGLGCIEIRVLRRHYTSVEYL